MRADVVPLLKHRFRQKVDEVSVDCSDGVIFKDWFCGLIQSGTAVEL